MTTTTAYSPDPSAPAAVSGAGGFIGSAVVRALLDAGRRVRVLLEPGAPTKNVDDLPPERVERVTVDVCDFAGMTRALAGAGAYYHLAAIYKIWLPDPSAIYRVNLEGTTTSLLAAQAAGVPRVVYTSSIAAIGLARGDTPADETNPFDIYDVANEYILTKYLSERIALRFAEAGLPLVVVNPAFPFGPRDLGPTPTGRVIVALLKGEVPAVGSGGFCAIDVADVAAGHLAAERKGRVGERYILGSHNLTFREFFGLVARIGAVKAPRLPVPDRVAQGIALGMELWADHVTHREPTATLKGVRYAQRNAYFDATKARRELGLPKTPIESSIQEAIRYFRDHGMA
jgi:dihydroflavonol-4-reductase